VYRVIPFVAPEILQGEESTKTADGYGFGIIAWEILVVKLPLLTKSMMNV